MSDTAHKEGLAQLEAAVERTGGRSVQYSPADKNECLSACQNMVLLITGRSLTEASKLAPKTSEDELETMSKISKWFKDRAASVGHNIGDRMADKIYQSCLLDCVDDWDRNFPKQLAHCWSKAKTSEDETHCNQLAADWRIRARAEGEVDRMKKDISTIERTAGQQTWAEWLQSKTK